ncbi:hypothetical protein COEREDRAFT_79391 [Coemansia reversa NRRL 1564]|uniref:PWWP domain-containing protein n=1 Tax=Coemansia reversa (strain ATCC 12441 / NRRL 1564) TaxID=763665 RepID=A0A2G5BIN3_COERN|nr:hypothetical protein COEREDRAFT_79391 [Coemansia reversa NRRL 1564]|eukprot:PIA18832.1 hypothetical protein COEREDRAFT_79391 [Coemansia reversa NRRL 1564]
MVNAAPTVLDTPRRQSPAHRTKDGNDLLTQSKPVVVTQVSSSPAIDSAKRQWRGRDVVFVDPLDTSAPYWWPAMIVPTDEIDTTMGCTKLETDEYLVKYFEDCKYSTVRGSELRVFSTSQRPFTDFADASPAFTKDKAIKSALSFLKTGHVQAKFQWRGWQTGSDTLHMPFALPMPLAVDQAIPSSISVDSDVSTLVAAPLEKQLLLPAPASPLLSDKSPSGSAPPSPPQQHPTSADQEAPEQEPSTPESAAAPVDGSSTPPPPSSSTSRTRRSRPQKTATGAPPRRGRPPLARRRQKSQQVPTAPANGSRRRRKQQQSPEITPASDEQSSAADPPQIMTVIKELEEVQEEYRIFRSLVKRAAKDLWMEMGNEWPPNLGTSTRFGKRRKVA